MMSFIIEKIEIPSEIDADGKIKEKLTQFPEKIKAKLKSSIRTALSGSPSSTTTSSTATNSFPHKKTDNHVKRMNHSYSKSFSTADFPDFSFFDCFYYISPHGIRSICEKNLPLLLFAPPASSLDTLK